MSCVHFNVTLTRKFYEAVVVNESSFFVESTNVLDATGNVSCKNVIKCATLSLITDPNRN